MSRSSGITAARRRCNSDAISWAVIVSPFKIAAALSLFTTRATSFIPPSVRYERHASALFMDAGYGSVTINALSQQLSPVLSVRI